MRVKIFKVAAMAVFVFITGLNVYKSQTSVQLSDAQLKNVEALASGEINPECPNGCVDGEGGCFCFEEYPEYREATWSSTSL